MANPNDDPFDRMLETVGDALRKRVPSPEVASALGPNSVADGGAIGSMSASDGNGASGTSSAAVDFRRSIVDGPSARAKVGGSARHDVLLTEIDGVLAQGRSGVSGSSSARDISVVGTESAALLSVRSLPGSSSPTVLPIDVDEVQVPNPRKEPTQSQLDDQLAVWVRRGHGTSSSIYPPAAKGSGTKARTAGSSTPKATAIEARVARAQRAQVEDARNLQAPLRETVAVAIPSLPIGVAYNATMFRTQLVLELLKQGYDVDLYADTLKPEGRQNRQLMQTLNEAAAVSDPSRSHLRIIERLPNEAIDDALDRLVERNRFPVSHVIHTQPPTHVTSTRPEALPELAAKLKSRFRRATFISDLSGFAQEVQERVATKGTFGNPAIPFDKIALDHGAVAADDATAGETKRGLTKLVAGRFGQPPYLTEIADSKGIPRVDVARIGKLGDLMRNALPDRTADAFGRVICGLMAVKFVSRDEMRHEAAQTLAREQTRDGNTTTPELDRQATQTQLSSAPSVNLA